MGKNNYRVLLYYKTRAPKFVGGKNFHLLKMTRSGKELIGSRGRHRDWYIAQRMAYMEAQTYNLSFYTLYPRSGGSRRVKVATPRYKKKRRKK